jgi:hypothetical protein
MMLMVGGLNLIRSSRKRKEVSNIEIASSMQTSKEEEKPFILQ